jgi:hypothetical protein
MTLLFGYEQAQTPALPYMIINNSAQVYRTIDARILAMKDEDRECMGKIRLKILKHLSIPTSLVVPAQEF